MRILRSAPILLALAAAGAHASSSLDPFKPGIKDQIELGKKAAKQLREEENVLPDDDPRVIELRRLGELLIATIPEKEREKRPFEYSFDVIDDPQVNAFALPGGPIFFFTGLLNRLETEDQVAGILAHEIVHIRNQHWASAYADNQKRQLGVTALLLLLGAGGTAFDIAGVADTLLFTLPYSRRHESESDKVGFKMINEVDYSPFGMIDVFKTLKEASKSKEIEEWMSSHPDTDRRIEKIEEMIEDSDEEFPEQRPRTVPKYEIETKDDGDKDKKKGDGKGDGLRYRLGL